MQRFGAPASWHRARGVFFVLVGLAIALSVWFVPYHDPTASALIGETLSAVAVLTLRPDSTLLTVSGLVLGFVTLLYVVM